VGEDESDIVSAEERDEFGYGKALMADFNSVTERAIFFNFCPSAAFHPFRMFAGNRGGGAGGLWQGVEKGVKGVGGEREVGRELPQDGAEFFLQQKNTGGKKIG